MTNGEHLQNCTDIICSHDPAKEQCYNCDEMYEWKEVPSGWDEEYCTECNERLNPYLCSNCNEEVDEPDTFCSKWCSQEYWL